MGAYITRRLMQGIPVLLIISAIVFAVVAFIPGDPAAVVLGHAATPENVAALRHQMGLDKPLPLGYATWLSHVLQGDLGHSILSRQPVLTLIGRALPITLYLSLFGLLIALAIALPAGTIAGLRRNSWLDVVFTTWAFLGVSIPGFWLAIVLRLCLRRRAPLGPAAGVHQPARRLRARVSRRWSCRPSRSASSCRGR